MRILEKLNQALTENDKPELTQIHVFLTEKVAALEREAQDKPDLLELLEKIKNLLAEAREEFEAGNEEAAKKLMFEAFRLLQGTTPKPAVEVRRPVSLTGIPRYADVKLFLESVQVKIAKLEEEGVNVDKAKRFLQRATDLLEGSEAADDDRAARRALHNALQELQHVDRTLDKQLEKIGRSMFQMIHRLEKAIEELQESDVDVSEIKVRMEEIMSLLDEAKDDWHERDFQEALNKMFEARELLLKTTVTVKELLA